VRRTGAAPHATKLYRGVDKALREVCELCVRAAHGARKDRDANRRALTAKCAAYLQRGIGLIVVDIVTSRHANLHDEPVALLGQQDGFAFPAPTSLYATA
jgi:hypothetical protein